MTTRVVGGRKPMAFVRIFPHRSVARRVQPAREMLARRSWRGLFVTSFWLTVLQAACFEGPPSARRYESEETDGPEAYRETSTDDDPDRTIRTAVSDGACGSAMCSGHGVCRPTSNGTECTCDHGFGGASCGEKTADYGRRLKIADNLADPDVLKLDDDHFVVTGTGGDRFDFYESNDLERWTRTTSYVPSAKDPDADYCFVWAPDIVRDAGKLWIYFSAHRGRKGATTCPPPAGSDVTTYRAPAIGDSLDFGKPEPLFSGTAGARTYPAAGCPSQGCSRAIRIDSTLYDGRLFYVFFANGGNNIASVSMTNNTDIRIHAGPAAFFVNDFEERINEAPELFEREGRRYMFFSGGFFDSQYATYYVMGQSTAELTRARPLQRLTTPVRRRNGTLAETHGHNAITTRRGEVFNVFHMGILDGSGRLVRRDTWLQRMTFKPDGTAMSQNQVRVSWNALGGGRTYSLDLVLRDGTVIGPCINAGSIGASTAATFVGICPDASDRLVHRAEVAAFRLYASTGGPFVQVGEAPYDGYADEIRLTL